MSITHYWRERPLAGRWTLKDIVQGRPLGHPTHAMFVHFPSALLPAAFVFDIISLFQADITFTRAAFYNIAFGLSVAALAALTGLVDYLPMIGGIRNVWVLTTSSLSSPLSASSPSVCSSAPSTTTLTRRRFRPYFWQGWAQ